MEVRCSNCKRKIRAENINAAKDIAFCSSCEELTPLSSLLGSTPSKNFEANSPEIGTTVDDRGNRANFVYPPDKVDTKI